MDRIIPENQRFSEVFSSLFRILSVFCVLVSSTMVLAVEPYEGTWIGIGYFYGGSSYTVILTKPSETERTTAAVFFYEFIYGNGVGFPVLTKFDDASDDDPDNDKWYGTCCRGSTVKLEVDFYWEASRVAFISVKPYPFDNMEEVSPSTFTITNDGSAALLMSNFVITGTDKADFSLKNNACTNKSLETFETCTLDIEFKPTTPGLKKAALEITSNASNDTSTMNFYVLEIPLSGSKPVDAVGNPTTTALGSGIVIHSDGNSRVSETTFVGATSVAGEPYTSSSIATLQQPLTIAATIKVDPADVGKTADILFVIGTEPPATSSDSGYDGGVDTTYTTINSNNQANPVDLYAAADVWMAQLTEPFKANVTLEATLPITLWTEQTLGSVGMYYFFVGYRLEDGTIIYNARPIMVEVQ